MNCSENILKWYPFEENSSILEIYDDESVVEKLNKNVELEKCYVKDFKLNGKYDYITLIGTYEYAPVILNSNEPYIELLKKLKESLNPNGKILIAIDNKLGVKYFSGAKYEKSSHIFSTIQNTIRNNKCNLLLKTQIESFIKSSGFKNYKFYYPLGDYKNANSIFTDEFSPKSNTSKITYLPNYKEGSVVILNEINILKNICDNNNFKDFTNSYFIEITDGECCDVKFVSYNIFRKEKYKNMLIMQGNTVKKYAKTEKSIEHIRNVKKYIDELKSLNINIVENVQDDVIISNFIDFEELDKKLVKEIEKENIDKTYSIIDKYYDFIKQKLLIDKIEGNDIFEKYNIEIDEKIKQKMHFTKYGYIDLSFENIFFKDNEYLFYDQEWYFENIPIEFILYRSINNLYTYNDTKIEEILNKEDIFNRYGLNEFIEYFEKIEKIIQNEILDEDAINEYRENNKNYYYNLEEFAKENSEIKEELKNLAKEHEWLLNEHNRICQDYNRILGEYNNSRGWKIIKGVRKLLRR